MKANISRPRYQDPRYCENELTGHSKALNTCLEEIQAQLLTTHDLIAKNSAVSTSLKDLVSYVSYQLSSQLILDIFNADKDGFVCNEKLDHHIKDIRRSVVCESKEAMKALSMIKEINSKLLLQLSPSPQVPQPNDQLGIKSCMEAKTLRENCETRISKHLERWRDQSSEISSELERLSKETDALKIKVFDEPFSPQKP